jgi:hypothetical protein
MDIDRLVELLRGLPFRQAVWLFPLATALHFLEEAPHFADWAGKYAWPGYTHQRWRRIHGLGMVFAIAFCGLASMFPNRAVVFLFFALCFSESVLNSMFHMGATAFFQRSETGSSPCSPALTPLNRAVTFITVLNLTLGILCRDCASRSRWHGT